MAKQSKQQKEATRQMQVRLLRIFTIVILLAGVATFQLPELTTDEALGTLSFVTLIVVVAKWVK